MERDTLEAIGALDRVGRIWGEYGATGHVDLQAIARDAKAAAEGSE